ncbi:MAG TPA: hypothetical protein VMF32_19285 [Xanthobacteraceae bacterium]|nr:hypothetical protein [Xanthobacteraceae bacterium]
MTRQADVGLFQIVTELGVGVEGWRNLTGPEAYRLSVAGHPDWFMTPQTAARLGRGAKTVSTRLQRARTHGEAVKAGAVFTGRSQDGGLMIELGTIDADAIYLQVGETPKLRLTGDQATALLAALALFDDVSIPVGPVRHTQLAIEGGQMFESWDWWR